MIEGCDQLKALPDLDCECCCASCHAEQDWYRVEATGPDGKLHVFRACCGLVTTLLERRKRPVYLDN